MYLRLAAFFLATAIATLFVVLLVRIVLDPGSFSEGIVIAMIGAASAIITILGSVLTTQLSNKAKAEQQLSAEVRKIKQEYYNKFIQVFSEKMSHLHSLETPDGYDANCRFMNEVNRLPLYASQEVVEWVSEWALGRQLNMKPSELYTLIRADLCSDGYIPFSNLNSFYFQVPSTRRPES